MSDSSAAEPRTVPRPRTAVPWLGPTLSIARDVLGSLDLWAREVGDIYRVDIPGHRTWVVNRPEEIGRVLTHHSEYFIKDNITRRAEPLFGKGLILSSGELWKKQRRMMQPAFRRQRVATYGPRIVTLTEQFVDTWPADQVRDVHVDAQAIALAVATDTFFGDNAVPTEVVEGSLDAVLRRFDGVRSLLPSWLPFGRFARCREGIAELDRVVFELVARRRQKPTEGLNDLLSILLAAQDDDGSVMTDRQLRDEMIGLLLAGHETVANTLTWTWHLLSTNPEAEQKMFDEVDALTGDVSQADHTSLSYTMAVMQESMRLFPPIWILSREVIKDWEVAGFPVPRGMQISMMPWIVHRDPRFFPDPLEFRPERWLDDSAKSRPDYSYFPFGGGQRLCIGRPFGELEATMVLATVARRYRLRPIPGRTVVPLASLTLRPRGGLPMRPERR